MTPKVARRAPYPTRDHVALRPPGPTSGGQRAPPGSAAARRAINSLPVMRCRGEASFPMSRDFWVRAVGGRWHEGLARVMRGSGIGWTLVCNGLGGRVPTRRD